MKKITLKSIKNQEILSHDELKKITGGSDGSGDGSSATDACAGKKEWESCTQSNGNTGQCQYLPFNSGLVCFKN